MNKAINLKTPKTHNPDRCAAASVLYETIKERDQLIVAAQEILDRPWWQPENLQRSGPPISQKHDDDMRASDIMRLREAVDFALRVKK